MKTVSRNISLAEDLEKFAVQEAEDGGYGNVSAYFAELVRKRRQEQIDADVKFLADATRGAPSNPPIDKIVATTKAVRRQMRREKWTPK